MAERERQLTKGRRVVRRSATHSDRPKASERSSSPKQSAKDDTTIGSLPLSVSTHK